MYDVMHLPSVIEIGKTGENQFRKLEFDLRPWLAEMPDGVGSIVHIRPGETGDDAYVAATTMEDGILTWILSAGDIGEVEGYGQMEVWLEDLTGARGKSARCQTFVRSSLAPTSETTPEAQEAWLEQMTGLKTQTVIAAQSAEDAKEAAESAQAAAEAARDAAQAVAGDFQGLSATASGLAAGTSPTVNVTHDEGGLFNLAFGIPKGDKGDQGDPPTDSQVQTAANNYLSQVITNPSSPPLDRALSSNAAAAPADMVGDLKSAIDDFSEYFVVGKNLLNPNATTVGYMSAADGRIDSTGTSYLTSDYIPIASGQKITISPKCRKFLAFDETKTAIQATYINDGTTQSYTYTATVDGYIRISYLASATTEQIEYGDTVTSYEPFKITLADGLEFNNEQKQYIADQIADNIEDIETDVADIQSAVSELETDTGILQENMDAICDEVSGTNIYNPNIPYVTGWLRDNGSVDATGTGANFATTVYISIKQNTNYVVANVRITESVNIGSRILVALYDEDKNYISGTFQNVVNVNPMQVTFNSNTAFYVRVSTLPKHMGKNPTSEWRLFVGEGTTSPAIYTPYYLEYINKMRIISGYGAVTSEELNDIRETVTSKNIYDASKPTTTGWLRDTGNVDATGTGANFATTDYIPVEKSTSYVIANERMNIAGSVIGSRILMALYDADKTYITGSFQNVVNVNPMQVTFGSGNAAYLRVSTLPEHMGETPTSEFALIVQKGTTLDGYTTYWKKNVSVLYPSDISSSDNILFGKKYVACGDSLTAGDFTGYTDGNGKTGIHSDAFSPEYGTYKTYPYWIAKRNGMVLVNSGINGSTMAISKEYIDGTESSINYRSPFSYQRYQQIPSDADYITIWFGVNDSSHTYLGTIDDTENTTFYGAWNVVLPYLVEHHPNAKIGIVITFGIPDSPYTVAVREIAKKWGIPYYDFARGEQSPIIIRNKDTGYEVDSRMVDMRLTQFRVAVDNNHPNMSAHKFESTCLEAWLRSL